MIYDYPDEESPIRQGDIFVGLPRVDISLRQLPILESVGPTLAEWRSVVDTGAQVTAILPVRPVPAIVATQDCDAAHGQDITLCEIRDFRDVEHKARDTQRPSSWVNILTQHARLNLKWFYLPPDAQMGFGAKQAVDFTITIRVRRADLEGLRQLRKGRLNPVADEHFRERLSEFYRRYPYDEWYALNAEELAEYVKRYPDIKRYPWQS